MKYNIIRGLFMGLKILLAICYILFFVFLPLYDKAYWPEPTKKSLANKIVAATMFVAIGVLGMIISDNKTIFASTMIVGLICGWFGDILMHIPSKKNMTCLYIGAVGFLVGHIFYVMAFVNGAKALSESYKFFTVPELIAFVVVYVAFLLMLKPVFKFTFDSKFLQYGLYLYGIFLIGMLFKVIAFAITYFKYGTENSIISMIILIVAGISFFVSDLTLGIRLLGGRKDSKFIKSLSLYTYFIAQLLLATSILFIKI
jgi:uncharacterized membrane protein YhhN